MIIKRICCIVLFFAFIHVDHLRAQTVSFTIEGNFKEWPAKQWVHYEYLHQGKEYRDSVLANRGRFKLNGTLPEPTLLSVYTPAPNKFTVRDNIHLLVGPGKIRLKHGSKLKDASVQAPKLTTDYRSLELEIMPLRSRQAAIMIQARGSHQDSEQGRIKELNNEFTLLADSVRQSYIRFVQKNPGSFASLLAIKNLDGANFSSLEIHALFESLHRSVKQTPTGQLIASSYRTGLKTAIGAVLEDFTSLDTSRNPLSLSDITAKSKLTLVEFWASWCKPCREENPNLRKLYGEFHQDGFNILGVSLDRDLKSWRNAIDQDQLPWYHVSGLEYWNEPVVKQFGISGVPDSFLLDGDGRIVARGLRGDKLYEVVKSHLGLEMDSTDIANQRARFRQTDDPKEKEHIYKQLIVEKAFQSLQYADLFTASMESDIALLYLHNDDQHAFFTWAEKIDFPSVRERTLREGYRLLADRLETPADRAAFLRAPLDSMLTLRPWTEEQKGLYGSLMTPYMKALESDRQSNDLLAYMTPWYEESGHYFPSDISVDFDTLPGGITNAYAYQYARELHRQGELQRALDILTQAVEIGAFSLEELLVDQADFSNLPQLEEHVRHHLAEATRNYSDKVRRLLSKNTLDGAPLEPGKLKAKYIVIDFWGSWCLPCRFSHPKLIKIHEEYKVKGLEIISVAYEAPGPMENVRAKWVKAVKEDKMPWIQLLNNEDSDEFDAVREFAIGVFPTKILIDENFNKVATFQGGSSTDEFEALIKTLLK